MVLDALRIALAVLVLILLPGWLLAWAVFPRRLSLRSAERLYVAFAGGMLLLMLVATVLGFLPHGDRGHLQSLAAGGLPNVELGLLSVSLVLFWVGVRRGAYPSIATRFPRLVAPWTTAATSKGPE